MCAFVVVIFGLRYSLNFLSIISERAFLRDHAEKENFELCYFPSKCSNFKMT